MPPQFWVDFYVFSVVVRAGSTVAASELLAMPQSTVSRKYRTFGRTNGLTVLGKSGSYKLPPGSAYYQQLVEAFAEYRRSSGQYSYMLVCSSELSRRMFASGTDYSLFPGFVLLSSVLLPWMRDSRLLDFSLTAEISPTNPDHQITLIGEFSPYVVLGRDEIGSFLRGFPFQFREIVSR